MTATNRTSTRRLRTSTAGMASAGSSFRSGDGGAGPRAALHLLHRDAGVVVELERGLQGFGRPGEAFQAHRARPGRRRGRRSRPSRRQIGEDAGRTLGAALPPTGREAGGVQAEDLGGVVSLGHRRPGAWLGCRWYHVEAPNHSGTFATAGGAPASNRRKSRMLGPVRGEWAGRSPNLGRRCPSCPTRFALVSSTWPTGGTTAPRFGPSWPRWRGLLRFSHSKSLLLNRFHTSRSRMHKGNQKMIPRSRSLFIEGTNTARYWGIHASKVSIVSPNRGAVAGRMKHPAAT